MIVWKHQTALNYLQNVETMKKSLVIFLGLIYDTDMYINRLTLSVQRPLKH
jgi:hypothetical protein